MDYLNSVNLVVLATSAYSSNPVESTSSQFIGQLEVLIGILKVKDAGHIFNTKNKISSQCLVGLMDVVVGHNTDSHLISKIFQLLDTCITSIPVTSKFMSQVVGQVNEGLISYVVQHASSTVLSNTLIQCFQLLEKLTYPKKLPDSVINLDKFIDFLLLQVDDVESECAGTCLGILSNIVSKSMTVQAQVKGNMETARVRSLMSYLKQSSVANKVSVLTIITHVCWGDDLTKKLYNLKNVTQTLKLLLSCITNVDHVLTQHRAADLFVELLKHRDISQQFAIYESDQNCSSRLIMLLRHNTLPAAATKVLKVLVAFCRISIIRRNMCNRILQNEEVWQILLKCTCQPANDETNLSSISSVDLISELCEEVVDYSAEFSDPDWLTSLLSAIAQQLKIADSSELMSPIAALKGLKWIKILNCLCNDDYFKSAVASAFSISSLTNIIEHHLTHNLTNMFESNQLDSDEVGVDVILNSLQLALSLKDIIPDAETMLYTFLQDSRIVPFLAHALTSSGRSRIQTAIRLIQEALPLPDYPDVHLAEKIAQINERKMHKSSLDETSYLPPSKMLSDKSVSSPKQMDFHQNGDFHDKLNVPSCPRLVSNGEEKDDIQSLISKVQTEGGAVSSDPKSASTVADVMEIYENKISSLITKGSHLQDLLEAKALALSQADRLINQHRRQQARSEADAVKLAEMLRDSEAKYETLLGNVRSVETDRLAMEQELQTVVEENCNLQNVADQYDKMQFAFQDKTHKIEVLERNLKTSRQEYDTLKELHEMIQKHNEKMKEQQSQSSTRIEEMEEERMRLLKRISELEISISDLTQLIEEQDKAAKTLMQEKSEQEVANKNLKLQVGKRDENIKELKIKVSSQEQRRQQMEHQVKDKNSEIKKLHHKIDSLGEKVETLSLQRIDDEQTLSDRDNEINGLKRKLEKQAQTLLMITELSNNIQSSQT